MLFSIVIKPNVWKYVRFFCLIYLLGYAYPAQSIGVAVGPTIGISGWSKFCFKKEGHQAKKFTHMAGEAGLFGRVNLGFLYAKVDLLGTAKHFRFPSTTARWHYYISCPVAVGISLFELLYINSGIVFKIPFSRDRPTSYEQFFKLYEKKVHGYFWGVGVDLGNFLLNVLYETTFSDGWIPKRVIDAGWVNGTPKYLPAQIVIRLSYNLIGL